MNEMSWAVEFHPKYELEFLELEPNLQDEILAMIGLLERFGPSLGRPHADTLKGSKHANMKELRIHLAGVWRIAYAFDPKRTAILLVGGDKQGVSETRFYRNLIRIADHRFDEHLGEGGS